MQSEHAQRIAANAHAGQTDKAGRPYIEPVARVDLLTRRPGERYQDYIRRIAEAGDPDARAVKLADLRDHLEHHPEAIGANLRRRYEEALRTLGKEPPAPPR